MPRLIEGAELSFLQPHLEYAKIIATQAECAKDSRGVVIFRGERVLSHANNSPIWPHHCRGIDCYSVCGLIALHAERRALMSALESKVHLQGSSMLHVRVEFGDIQTSGPLRCEDCSGYLLRANRKGVGLQEFILPQKDGLIGYTIPEMDRITRRNLKLK